MSGVIVTIDTFEPDSQFIQVIYVGILIHYTYCTGFSVSLNFFSNGCFSLAIPNSVNGMVWVATLFSVYTV